jgi:hypothetical protein
VTPLTFLLIALLVAAAFSAAIKDVSAARILLLYGIVLAVGGAISLSDSLARAAFSIPNFGGSDGEGYYREAAALVSASVGEVRQVSQTNYAGFQLLLSWVFAVAGVDVGAALLLNLIVLMLAMCVLYRATELITESKNAAKYALLAATLTPTHIFNAVMLLKEPLLCLATALLVYSCALVLRNWQKWSPSPMYFALSLILVVLLRPTLLTLVLLLLLFTSLESSSRRRYWFFLYAAILVASFPLASVLSKSTIDVQFLSKEITRNDVIKEVFAQGAVETGGVVGSVLTWYLSLSFFQKIAWFFIPVLLQIALPFDFWSTEFASEHFGILFHRNLNPLWFVFVAPWAIFSVSEIFRLRPQLLKSLTAAGAIGYAGIAVIYGGAIPRYATPVLFLLYPSIGYCWERYHIEPPFRSRVRRSFGAYYLLGYVLLTLYLFRKVT